MQLFILSAILSTVLCQQGTVRSDNWSLNLRRFDECVRVDGRATSFKASRGAEIRVYKGTNCRGPHYWAVGDHRPKNPVDFQSAWIIRTVNNKSAPGSTSESLESSQTENAGGDGKDEAARIQARSLYLPQA